MPQKSELVGATLDAVGVPLSPIQPTESEVVIDQTYLPFTPSQLLEHFAPVASRGDPNRYLTHYVTSQRNREEFRRSHVVGPSERDPRLIRLGNQMEKHERFWVVAALMSIY